VDYAEALRGFFGGNAQPDPGYAGPLRQMIDPLAGKRSVGEMPSTQYAVKEVGRSAVEPFGQLGRLMTGTSQDTLADIVGAAAGLAPIGPPGAGKALKAGAEVLEGAAAKGATGGLGDFIKAYHGSPHDFERFDLSKIGTGEGAQAYGHGLYFAENENVAKGYRDTLSATRIPDAAYLDPDLGAKLTASEQRMKDINNQIMEARFAGKNEQSINKLRGKLDKATNDHLDLIEKTKFPGRMYQVAIKANPEHFLDWDKPLSEQPHILEKVPELAEAAKKEAYNRALGAIHQDRADELWGMVKDPTKAPAGFAVQAMSPRVRGGAREKEASEMMRERGIPGIKYLDQGSRGKGDGTRNYVVFDDKLIDILKKYGIAGIGALPAMNAYHYQDKGD